MVVKGSSFEHFELNSILIAMEDKLKPLVVLKAMRNLLLLGTPLEGLRSLQVVRYPSSR